MFDSLQGTAEPWRRDADVRQVERWRTAAPVGAAQLEAQVDVALRACGRQRPAIAGLAADVALIDRLLALYVADPEAYRAIVAPRAGMLCVWTLQVALAVAAAGWPRAGWGLCSVLPELEPPPHIRALVFELGGGR